MDFNKAFAAWSEASKVAFDDDRTATIGASEIGGCARQVGYKKSNTPQDKEYVETQGFAARGNIMENYVLAPVVTAAVEALGGELLWAGQENQMRLVNAKRKVSSTPDGLAINLPKDALKAYGVADITNGDGRNHGEVYVELKSIDPRVAAHKLPKDQHVDQVNLGMGMVRETEFEDGLVYEPNYAVIVYQDASDYSKFTIKVVAFDAEGYKGQLLRAKQIMDAAAQGTKVVELLRPEGNIAKDGSCQYCAFSKRCLGYAAMVPRAAQNVAPDVVKKVKKLARELQAAQDKAGKHDKDAANIEAELKETLAQARTNFLTDESAKDKVTLAWSTRDGGERFDTEAAKKKLTELGVDISTMTKKTKPSESLRVEYVNKLAT